MSAPTLDELVEIADTRVATAVGSPISAPGRPLDGLTIERALFINEVLYGYRVWVTSDRNDFVVDRVPRTARERQSYDAAGASEGIFQGISVPIPRLTPRQLQAIRAGGSYGEVNIRTSGPGSLFAWDVVVGQNGSTRHIGVAALTGLVVATRDALYTCDDCNGWFAREDLVVGWDTDRLWCRRCLESDW